MNNARSPRLVQQVRGVVRRHRRATRLSWEVAATLFAEYVGYYFEGLTTSTFLAVLADELLLALVQQRGVQPNDHFLDVLLAVSTAPSVSSSQERTTYLKTLEQFYESLRPEREAL